jgi:hypothetical protein
LPPEAARNLTDAGNAEHFVQMYGDVVRYDYARGRWLVWDAHRWRPDTDSALQAVRDRWQMSGDDSLLSYDERKALAKWGYRIGGPPAPRFAAPEQGCRVLTDEPSTRGIFGGVRRGCRATVQSPLTGRISRRNLTNLPDAAQSQQPCGIEHAPGLTESPRIPRRSRSPPPARRPATRKPCKRCVRSGEGKRVLPLSCVRAGCWLR